MRRRLTTLAIAAVAVGLLGFLVAWAGLVPIAASAGHWKLTEWFLHFTLRQSVQTRALMVAPPERALDDPALVLQGAGHFAGGCAPCHGAPGEARSPIVRQMTPQPPFLPPRIRQWEPEQLFWIVKHGIKFTGMPAWPAQQRDDEIWSVVAFLLRLPDMHPQEYARLAYGAQPGRPVIPREARRLRVLDDPLVPVLEACARCHGREGGGRGEGAFPVLAGQSEAYLLASLQAFSRGERHSGFMQPQAAALSEPLMRRLASHYAGQPPPPRASGSAEGEAWERGRRIAREGLPEQGVPACASCHGPGPEPRNPVYPELAGQYRAYLRQQLELWHQGRRGGTPYAHIMRTVGERLRPEQRDDVALYYSSLPPTSAQARPPLP